MTVKQDLEKATAAAQSALGTYSSFAVSMRLNYINQNNGSNQQQTT